MSRCYPFPPPGYVQKEKPNDSMIEPIKGTKEEVKREKKDRKHKKDKKRKERESEADRSKKHRHHKRRRKDESGDASKKVDDGGGLIVTNELECLEKSCLTVELEHQTSSQNSCDSSVHSSERRNHIQSPPFDGRHNDSGEFVCLLVVGSMHDDDTLSTNCCFGFEETSIRISLHGKGQKSPEAEVMMMTSKDQKQCASKESLDASQTAPNEFVGHTSANEDPRDALRVRQEKRRDSIFDSAIGVSTKLSEEEKTLPLKDVKSRESNRKISMPLGKEKPYSSHLETVGASKLCSKCPPSTAVRFLNLIENWAPDRVESKLTDSEDQELWLFVKVGAKRHHHQISYQTTSIESSSMVWPTARFLPEAELHALPFTVPF